MYLDVNVGMSVKLKVCFKKMFIQMVNSVCVGACSESRVFKYKTLTAKWILYFIGKNILIEWIIQTPH